MHRLPTRASLLLRVDLVVGPEGKAVWKAAQVVPLEMMRTPEGLQVVPIDQGGGSPAIVAYLRRVVGDWKAPLTPLP